MVFSRLLAAAALAAILPAAALAQPAPPPPGPPAGGGWAEHAHAHQAKRLQALHDILRIRPDQEGAFQAWVAAMRPERGGPDHGGSWGRGPGRTGPGPGGDGRMGPGPGAELASLTTPQRLDMMQQRMDARMARMRAEFQRRASATKALYAQLSPEQRKVMDDLPALAGGFGHHGDMGHDGWGGHEGWGGHGGMGPGMGGPGPMGPPPPPPSGD